MQTFGMLIATPYEKIKRIYDSGEAPLDEIKVIAAAALQAVTAHPKRELSNGYVSYGIPGSKEGVSRPIREDIFSDTAGFDAIWDRAVGSVRTGNVDHAAVNTAVYTCIQSFASAYDLYRRGARKTPGTFFEILIGSLLSQRIDGPRSKQVSLEVDGESVVIPTDIYFERYHLTIATKTSSRDRIIQPWSHQLLLDRLAAKLNRPAFRSVLCLVGEVQLGRDERRPCYPVCVPNQVRLYQEHVAQMYGLYYLDPPAAYVDLSNEGVIPVRTIGDLLANPPI